ncbi:unnamed protein product [Blumeria hordei]|uniref:Uncharacterized protein n=1 Tax=Blumeria hordei TaxID=2867405 RepID=A0A383UV34_BLUHO|nr:unnamed protein product [Blumeria hordei]
MRPFQLLPAITIFISLEILGVAGYWDCNGTLILYENVRAAVDFAFSCPPGSFYEYPSIYRSQPPWPGLGQLREFPITASGKLWQGSFFREYIAYYILATQDTSYCQVFATEGLGYECTHILG